MKNSALPLTPGYHTQEAIAQIKRDASQEAFPSSRVPSRSTVYKHYVKNVKKKGKNRSRESSAE